MFEGKPPRPRDARALDDEQPDIDALRPLSWSDLVARLSAVRDQRVSPEDADVGGEASFDAGSARRIAAQSAAFRDFGTGMKGSRLVIGSSADRRLTHFSDHA